MDTWKHERPSDGTRAAATRPLACICLLLLLSAAAAAGCVRTPSAPPSVAEPQHAAAPDTVTLVLLGTTDVHGRLYPYDYYTGDVTDNGLARLKPLVDSVRSANPGRVYLFDSGDLLQGNPLGYVYARVEAGQPNPIIRAMNLLGYTASTVGNHEFNYGLDHLDRAVAQAGFPFVTGNVYRHGTDEHAYRPYALISHVVAEGDTLLIGVTGNTPPGVHIWDRENVEGVLEFRDVVASLRPVVREMRERGADLVVVASHGGLEGASYDTLATGLAPENQSARLAREVPGIDVIFLGHTHRELADTAIAGVLLTQAAPWARSLAAATVRLERWAAGDWRVVAKQGEVLSAAGVPPDTAFLDSLRWEHERTVAWVNSVVGRSTGRMALAESRVRNTAIIDFINEVQRRATGAQLSAAAAFTLTGAIPEGDVTIGDVAGVYVYDNTLRAVRITGARLREFLEKSAEYYRGWPPPDDDRGRPGTVTDFAVPGYNFDIVAGVDYAIDVRRPPGDRIVDLTYEGQPVRPDQTFTMAVNSYRQAGGGGFTMLADAPVVYDRGEDVRDLLIEEVRRRGTIRPEDYVRENWRLVPAEAAAAALAEQLAREAPPPDDETRADRRRLRVLTTNDFHGRLLPETPGWSGGREVGGAAALAAHFAHERQGFAGPTVLLDGGDVMQGTPLSNLSEGRAAIAYYNAVGYDAAAVGNHEFDWGVPLLEERIRESEFAWLAANLTVAGADTAPSWVRPTALLEADGVRVGVIGLITEQTPDVALPAHVRGLEFGPLAPAVDRWVPALRDAGADFVIVVAHAGAVCEGPEGRPPCRGELIDAARAVRERPDLMVGGHTHQLVRDRVNGIPIVESGSYGVRYGVVDLERVSADSVSAWIRGFPVVYGDRVAPDADVARLVARWEAEIGPRLERVVATLAEPLRRRSGETGPGERSGEYALGRVIADAQRAAGGTPLAIMNNGGIRTDLDPGPVTWGDLFQLQPFQNRLVRLRLTGSQILAALEHALAGEHPVAHVSGLRVWYDPAGPAGRRVRRAELETGEPLRGEQLYDVTMNDFLAGGGDGFEMFPEAADRTDLGIIDLDALVEYLERLPQPVRGPAEPRFIHGPTEESNDSTAKTQSPRRHAKNPRTVASFASLR